MRKNLLYLYALLGVSLFFTTSCEKDPELDSIFFRNDGGLQVKVSASEDMVLPGAEVRLFLFDTDNEIDFQKTPENGLINFGRFKEGNYFIKVETELNGNWHSLYKEVQVLSGIDKVEEINLSEYTGTVEIIVTGNNNEIISDNLNLEVALVPINEKKLRNFTTDQELLAYAYKKVMIRDGKVKFEKVPAAPYNIYLVQNNRIVEALGYINVRNKEDDIFLRKAVNLAHLRLAAKETWKISGTIDQYGNRIDSPVTGIRFKQQNQAELLIKGGLVIQGHYSLNGNGYFDLSWSNSSDYYVYNWDERYHFDSSNNLVLTFSSFELVDYTNSANNFNRNSIKMVFN